MPGDHLLEVPEELELIDFFGVDPLERAPQEGYWSFEVKDDRGVTLRFSFNLFERSIQTELSIGGPVFETVSHELADRLHLGLGELRATFAAANAKTLLTVTVTPTIKVRWSTLRSR
jgi:hypothetical protein